jgi:hypothetical protein
LKSRARRSIIGSPVPKNSNSPLLRIVVGLLASAAAVFALIRSQELATHSGAIDFYQFWLIGQFIDQPGIGDIYAVTTYDRIRHRRLVYAGNSLRSRLKAAGQHQRADLRAQDRAHLHPRLYLRVQDSSLPVITRPTPTAISSPARSCSPSRSGSARPGRALRLDRKPVRAWRDALVVRAVQGGHPRRKRRRLQLAGLAMAVGAIAFLPQRAGRVVAGLLLALNVMSSPTSRLWPG